MRHCRKLVQVTKQQETLTSTREGERLQARSFRAFIYVACERTVYGIFYVCICV